MKKTLFCLLIAVFLIVPFAVSCDSGKEANSNGYKYFKQSDESAPSYTTSETVSMIENTSSTDDTSFIHDNGLEQRYLDGQTFTILTVDASSENSYFNCEFVSDDANGIMLPAAVTTRTQILRDQYGINLEIEYAQDPSTTLLNEVMAGLDNYQLYSDNLINGARLALNNCFVDLNTVSSLNLQNHWWNESVIDDLSLAGRKYFLSGDLMVSDKSTSWCCFYNKNMITAYGLENPYELVLDGKWTIDKLQQMAAVIGDDEEIRKYGFLTQTYDASMGMVACGQKIIEKDSNDLPVLNLPSEPSMVAFEKIYNIMTNTTSTLLAESLNISSCYDTVNSIFMDGRALFQYNSLSYIQKITDAEVEFEYGILPLPKFDESQEEYYSSSSVYITQFVSIPTTVTDQRLEDVGYVLELLGYYGDMLVTNAFKNILFHPTSNSPTENEEMFDIISYNRTYDLANVYNFGNTNYFYTSIILSDSNTYIATAEAQAAQMHMEIDMFIEQLND